MSQPTSPSIDEIPSAHATLRIIVRYRAEEPYLYKSRRLSFIARLMYRLGLRRRPYPRRWRERTDGRELAPWPWPVSPTPVLASSVPPAATTQAYPH